MLPTSVCAATLSFFSRALSGGLNVPYSVAVDPLSGGLYIAGNHSTILNLLCAKSPPNSAFVSRHKQLCCSILEPVGCHDDGALAYLIRRSKFARALLNSLQVAGTSSPGAGLLDNVAGFQGRFNGLSGVTSDGAGGALIAGKGSVTWACVVHVDTSRLLPPFFKDTGNHRVRRLWVNSTLMTLYSGVTLNSPASVASDGAGGWVVSDFYYARRYAPPNSNTILAGNGSRGFSDGAKSTTTMLFSPQFALPGTKGQLINPPTVPQHAASPWCYADPMGSGGTFIADSS